MHDAAMVLPDTFRSAGGTGSKHQPRAGFGGNFRKIYARKITGKISRNLHNFQLSGRKRIRQRQIGFVSQQQICAGTGEHRRQLFRRMIWVEREINFIRLEHAKDRGNQRRGVFHQQRHRF